MRLIELPNEAARAHFLKSSSYFNNDLPRYISFEPMLKAVSKALGGDSYTKFKKTNPNALQNVNYSLIANKDGRFAWRPYELMHPAIYVSLVNVICETKNWKFIKKRFKQFEGGMVECCSVPVISIDQHTDTANQVKSWWKKVEQRSLVYSLEFSHLLHTDVTDCYGSLYTHSIAWALHGREYSKQHKHKKSLLGNKIDSHVQAGRYGQTNGIPQGSVLMDFIAEIVLGYVDEQINEELSKCKDIKREDIKILRYRDDYRIFANSDKRAGTAIKIISDKLREVGMKLGAAKTIACKNVVEGAIKPDKLAGIDLRNLGTSNAKTIQKQLLRLHSFSQRFPNSGALRRLMSRCHSKISKKMSRTPDDLDVQIAIVTDIAVVSPSTFQAVAGILSHLISFAPEKKEKKRLWDKVRKKMARVPHNGYLEIWLQRVTQPKKIGIRFKSKEAICRIVNGKSPRPQLWESSWISNKKLKKALAVKKIVIADVYKMSEVVPPKEIELFRINSYMY